jgi:hypothetical protein
MKKVFGGFNSQMFSQSIKKNLVQLIYLMKYLMRYDSKTGYLN